jgi:preprotein translocase subunit SecY
MFTGGALGRMGIFALGHHALYLGLDHRAASDGHGAGDGAVEEGRRGGAARRSTSTPATARSLLATVQAYGLAVSHGIRGDWRHRSLAWFFRFACMITLVGGTMFLMWLGEQITARGVGNGISLIIFVGIIAEMPAALAQFLESLGPVRRADRQPGNILA